MLILKCNVKYNVKEKAIESFVTLWAWAHSVVTHLKWLVNNKQRGSMAAPKSHVPAIVKCAFYDFRT